MNRFDQKEQRLHQELACVIDLDKCKEDQNRICQNFKEYAFETYKSNNRKNITKATQQLIDHVAQDFQINTDEFMILTDKRDIPATMRGCVLYVNENLLTSYSTKAQQYVVAHEFGHMVYDDGAFITALQNQLDMDNEQNSNLFDSLSRFQEARADIFAGTKNLAYAEGGIEFFNDLYQRYGDPLAISHPQTLDRIEANKTIAALHNQTTIAVA